MAWYSLLCYPQCIPKGWWVVSLLFACVPVHSLVARTGVLPFSCEHDLPCKSSAPFRENWTLRCSTSVHEPRDQQENHLGFEASSGRAQFLTAAAGLTATTLMALARPAKSDAAPETSAPSEAMVDFVDSRGLFSCRVPAKFLRAGREKDKRGTVFVAGNYDKAEVLSVQVISAADLLKDAGMPPLGPLIKWEDLGNPRTVTELLKQRRDADLLGTITGESVVLPGISLKGDVLEFTLRSQIKVMRPDLLQKQQGVSELFRNTLVKAIMRGDGTFLVMWAGALSTDWDQEGGARDRLRLVVESFQLEGLVVNGVRLGVT